jgi:hypothetical protein
MYGTEGVLRRRGGAASNETAKRDQLLVGCWSSEGRVQREVARRRCLVPALWFAAVSRRALTGVEVCVGKERWRLERSLAGAEAARVDQQVTLSLTRAGRY